MYTYFIAMKNSRVVTLAYVILKTPDSSRIVIYGGKKIIKNDPLQVNIFSHDTKKVLEIHT